MEIFKDIEGYELLYQVSNFGRVKSIIKNKYIGYKINCKYNEYPRVTLYKNGKRKTFRIHHLVWDQFGDNERNGLQVDHIDEIKSNNHIDNLQLLTNRQNNSKTKLTKKDKTSKYTGVDWMKCREKWRSRIQINGKHHHLGYYDTQEEASKAYQNKLEENGTNS